MGFTSDDFVASVRRLAFLPDASDITATDILALADEETLTIIGDRVKAQRGEQWVTYEDQATSPTQLEYPLPRRCFGRMVRGVSFLSSGNVLWHATEIDLVTGADNLPVGVSAPYTRGGYSFRADKIVFPAPPPPSSTLRVHYLRRPSLLVPVAQGASVVSCGDATTVLVDSVPAWLSTQTQPAEQPPPPPLYVDIVRGDAPYDQIEVDRLLSFITLSTSNLTFLPQTPLTPANYVDRAAIPNDRVDYVCLRDQTVYPQLPNELFPVLVAAVVRRIMEELGDQAGMAGAADTLERRKKAAEDIIAPRNEQGNRKIVNRSSALRSNGWSGRRWR